MNKNIRFQNILNKKFLSIYIIIYFIVMLIIMNHITPMPTGEWDDYSLVTASIIKERNISITKNDIKYAEELFPEWNYNDYLLSGYEAKDGGEMSWYFPTYSIICVPLVIILSLLNIPAIYAFCYTNLLVFLIMALIIYNHKKISDKKKILLTLLLSINPIVLYFHWISAEVLIFVLIAIGMLHWTNKEYKRAAIYISLASTLNPTILCIGIIMIVEFISNIWFTNTSFNFLQKINYTLSQWKKIIIYGCCYLIALVPFIYNFYNVGHINLTAAQFNVNSTSTTIFERFLAYLFDANFGIMPYFSFVFLLSIVLFFIAIMKREYNYIRLIISFFITVFSYSFMIHINSGMTGIARYNVWSFVIIIFAVVLYGSNLLINLKKKVVIGVMCSLTILINLFILYSFGTGKNDYSYVSFTPFAKYILNNYPNLYNPLPSTFNSRINHIDGGYGYETPIIYTDKENNIRKILASKKDINELINKVSGSEKDMEWFLLKLNQLNDNDDYISIPKRYTLLEVNPYDINKTYSFSGEIRTAEKYVIEGLSANEITHSWTEGNLFKLSFKITDTSIKTANITFNILDVFNLSQRVLAYVNENEVFNNTVYGGQNLEFNFNIPASGIINLELQLPDAISPKELGISNDSRVLSLCLKDMTIIEYKN